MSKNMTTVEELLTCESLRQLKYKYARALDDKNWTSLRECFTHDLEFEVPSTGPMHGPDQAVRALSDGFKAFAFTLHECAMPNLTLLGPTEAQGLWDIHTITITTEAMQQPVPEQIHGYGRYHERYRKVGADWKIAKLTLVRRFKDKQPFVAPSESDAA